MTSDYGSRRVESVSRSGPSGLVRFDREIMMKRHRARKGGDPAAPSGTATLLRLNPSH